MIRYAITALILFVLALGTWAQESPPQHQHQHLNMTVVDGAKNPELIPDSTAYRLWLVTVSLPANASDTDRAIQEAHLKKVHLPSADHQQLLHVLTDFKSQYLDLIARYNEAAKNALLHGGQADQAAFQIQREALVANARAAINVRLTQRGASNIDAHIQDQKKRMKIHTTAGGQQ